MKTTLTPTPLEGLVVVDIDFFEDDRGFFIESWNRRDFADAGLDQTFVQDNHSLSQQGVVRGLHYQDGTEPLAKLVRCTRGQIFDVAVDIRAGSETFGRWFGLELAADNKRQLWISAGFAHGFATLSPETEVQYKQTAFYSPESEGGLPWDDPDIGIDWPVDVPLLSARDRKHPSFADYRLSPVF